MRNAIIRHLLLAVIGSLASASAGEANGNVSRPTDLEEEIRWHTNRARWRPANENTLRGTNYPNLPQTAPPLATSPELLRAARNHSGDLARTNLFQHETVPGSQFYNPVTQPEFWDRVEAEGYNYTSTAENIAAGYDGALACYLGWWTSNTGHRESMMDAALLEVGASHAFRASSRYGNYYTMDLGSRSGSGFFTGTCFFDQNQDGVYGVGEGRGNLAVRLTQGSTGASVCGLTGAAGDFQVPLTKLPAGAQGSVEFVNLGTAAVTLTLPTGFSTSRSLAIPANGTVMVGSFHKPSAMTNIGLRQLEAFVPELFAPALKIVDRADGTVKIEWSGKAGTDYRLLAGPTPAALRPLGEFQTGTGQIVSKIMPKDAPQKFFAVQFKRSP